VTNTLHNGDIVLTGRKSQGLISHAIRLGSKLRYGTHSPYTIWAHAALVTDAPNHQVTEARSHGVTVSDIRDRFPQGDYAIIPTGQTIDPHDLQQVLDFARTVVQHRTRYGYLTFIGLAIYCLTGGGLCIQQAGTAICSGFVCDALTRAGYIWNRPPYAMMPADIAAQLQYQP
jgi:hypothetical protein